MTQDATASPAEALSSYMAAARGRALPRRCRSRRSTTSSTPLRPWCRAEPLLPGRKAIAFASGRGGAAEASVVGTKLLVYQRRNRRAGQRHARPLGRDRRLARAVADPPGLRHCCGSAGDGGDAWHAAATTFLRAVALGYDVGTRFTMCLDALNFREEGHSTHSFGPTFGAAAAAASLARLDARRMRHVLTYAGQQASGVGSWIGDLDHIEKAFDFGGMPARNGVTAALFVLNGFTATDDMFSGPRNFFQAYSHPGREIDRSELTRGLGSSYEVMNTNIKRWSVGSPIQAPLDSLLELIRAHGLKADDVEQVIVRVSHTGATTTDNRAMPDICMQQMCAVMLMDGIVTFDSAHDEARMHDATTLEVRRRIELLGDDELQARMPGREGIVEVTLKDGRQLRHHTVAVRGTAENPMTRAEVDEKCYHLMTPRLGNRRSRELCDAVWNLEACSDLRDLRPLLSGRA